MVKTGHMPSIRQMTYEPPAGVSSGVETMSFARLRELDRGVSERGDFFVVALVTAGQGEVDVDYVSSKLSRHSVAWIGAGVVHRWIDITNLEGDVILFTPTAPVAPSARAVTAMSAGTGAVLQATPHEWTLLERSVAHLRAEFEARLTDPSSPPEILSSLLSAFILRATPADKFVAAGNAIFREFRDAVEAGLGSRHDVEFYASELGYSARTLSRASQSATGRSAKAFINERVILEAKRLLAHEGYSLKATTRRLGFSDASAFSAFFRRETGSTPGAWRDDVLPGS